MKKLFIQNYYCAVLFCFSSILILKTASFPQNGPQKTVQQGLNLSVSSFRVEDYGPSADASASPSLRGRIDASPDMTPKSRPKCAKPGSTYCTRSENYPTAYINDLITKGVIKFNGFQDKIEDFNLTNKIDATDEIPLCASRERVVTPTEGETESGDWFFILNTDKIKQGVRVEECFKPGQTCSLLPNSIETHCEQKYIFRQMIGLSGSGAEEMKFKIPSCCMCTVSHRTKRKLPPLPKRDRRQVATKKSEPTFNTDAVIFPQSAPAVIGSRGSFTPEDSCAKGSTYCKSSPNYPKQYVKMLVKMNALRNLPIFQEKDDEPAITLTSRFGGDDTLCGYTSEKVFPEAGKTKDKNWEWIVQFGEEEQFKQAVKLELCQSEGSACNYADKFPSGYVTTCKQKFVYRQLLALSSETGEPQVSHFQLPSCCVCHVKSTMSIAARFGVPDAAPTSPAKNQRRKK